jgi:hypothetical protein
MQVAGPAPLPLAGKTGVTMDSRLNTTDFSNRFLQLAALALGLGCHLGTVTWADDMVPPPSQPVPLVENQGLAAPAAQPRPVQAQPIVTGSREEQSVVQVHTFPEDDNWTVTIIPGPSSRERQVTVNGVSYQQAYDSVPYSRTEYLANPGYRHEAAMELLFGQLRPTTIVRQSAPQAVVNPQPVLQRPYLSTPSDFYSYPWQYGLFPGMAPYFGPQMPGQMFPRLTY